MNLGHCPICWDGYASCRCSHADYAKYETALAKSRQDFKNDFRKQYHAALDKTIDRITTFDCENLSIIFLLEYLRGLDKPTWIELRKQLDKKFKI